MANNKRAYNSFFNIHTVTGITITVGLFVIFFAGAFTIFRDEINLWHYNRSEHRSRMDIDYERIIEDVEKKGHQLHGRDLNIRYRSKGDYIRFIANALEKPKDSTTVAQQADAPGNGKRVVLRFDPESYTQNTDKNAEKEFLGTFIYELHFFSHLPIIGTYLAGFIAFFFALATISGIVVHWKKIVPNFFSFRIKGSLKNLWTDAHVALGVLGLPFQLLYAVTGAYFCTVLWLFYFPTFFVRFEGNSGQFIDAIVPQTTFNEFPPPDPWDTPPSINTLIGDATKQLDPETLDFFSVDIKNYNEIDCGIHIGMGFNRKEQFVQNAIKVIRFADGKVLQNQEVGEDDYVTVVGSAMRNLHYVSYGGYFMRVVYFIMALITCFVIISGVMIWLTARDNKKYETKTRFNRNIGAIFMGACMGLYPAMALLFCLVKIFPSETKAQFGILANVFFLFWLAFSVSAFFIKSTYKINRYALISGGIIGMAVPVLNGMQSGIWFWNALAMDYVASFFVDVCWLMAGGASLVIGYKVRPLDKKKQDMVRVGQKSRGEVKSLQVESIHD